MPTDPNARRDKALADITGYLKSIDRSLKVIARNTQPARFIPDIELEDNPASSENSEMER